MGIINRYDLERFDEGGAVAPIGNPYKRTDNIMKSGSRGESVKWLQYVLNEKGYDLKIDGIFGPKTEQAVRNFQTKVFVDGIVGEFTLKKLS
jgi:peptidoglycan hydrolase-like protein with peptidoglycan-binding domain